MGLNIINIVLLESLGNLLAHGYIVAVEGQQRQNASVWLAREASLAQLPYLEAELGTICRAIVGQANFTVSSKDRCIRQG